MGAIIFMIRLRNVSGVMYDVGEVLDGWFVGCFGPGIAVSCE